MNFLFISFYEYWPSEQGFNAMHKRLAALGRWVDGAFLTTSAMSWSVQ
jgi:hypothetical protein